MKTFGLTPCRLVGDIKNAIKDAMLDGVIANDYDAAYTYMIEKGRELKLVPVKE
jgi:poly(A) polymerase